MAWQPLPGNESPPAALVGGLIDRVMASIGAPTVDTTAQVVDVWPELVGPVAPHARAVAIQDGTLTVHVDGPAYADHIRWAEQDLLAALDERCPGVVAALKIVVGRS